MEENSIKMKSLIELRDGRTFYVPATDGIRNK